MAFGQPPAYMGFVGFARIKPSYEDQSGIESILSGQKVLVRTSAFDVNLSQAIEAPNVVDSRYDRTVYQLGPKMVDGSFTFPGVYDMQTGDQINIVEAMYKYAVLRGPQNGLLGVFDMDVKYAQASATANQPLCTFIRYNNWRTYLVI